MLFSDHSVSFIYDVLYKDGNSLQQKYEKPRPPEDAHMEMFMKSKKVFNSRQMAALKGLYNWRDKTARTEDESTG